MICFPNAKINLGLSVIERRPDGMHNIKTCYIPISIYDILEIQPSNKFSLVQSGLPLDCSANDNLINKVWNLLLNIKGDIKPVKVLLYKNIPVGSGLAGGSSDAAFFMKAINQLYSLNLSISELEILASKIGADCPFFIKNKPTIATGIGNIFAPLNNPIQNMYLAVIFPNKNISTKKAFGGIIPSKCLDLSLVINGKKPDWKNKLKNDFEAITMDNFPEIQIIKNALYKLGAMYVSITGSGSAIYALSSKPIDLSGLDNKYRVWSDVLVL